MHFALGCVQFQVEKEHVGRDIQKLVGGLGLQLIGLICARDIDLRNQSSKYYLSTCSSPDSP